VDQASGDDEAAGESRTVLQKKLTEKKIQKHRKSVNTFLSQKLDLKQIAKAVKALQNFSKAKRAGISKNLLEDEADAIHVSFTLT
jgi:hypothetical protein